MLFDGHGNHLTREFQDVCEKNHIKIQCIPPHVSNRLQPLDLECFPKLKTRYKVFIDEKIDRSVSSLDKFELLGAYSKQRKTIFTTKMIESSFRKAGLFPFDPDHTISQLPRRVTPSTPKRNSSPFQDSSTPNTFLTPSKCSQVNELQKAFLELLPSVDIPNRMRAKKIVEDLVEIAHAALQSDAINARKISAQYISEDYQGEKKVRPRKLFIIGSEKPAEDISETVLPTSQILPSPVQNNSSTSKSGSPKRKRRPPTCSNCRNPGHRIQTCPQKS